MIGQRQKMNMQQKLTPQQVMMLRLLHMPLQELTEAIKDEVEKNPLLEVEEMPMEQLPDRSEAARDEAADDDYDTRTYATGGGEKDRGEWQMASEPSFVETLQEQFDMKNLSEEEQAIGHELIGSLDDSGYMTRDLGIVVNDLALYKGIETTEAEVEKVLRRVQSLEPAGIAARTLQECLSIQLHRMGGTEREVRLARKIVDMYFETFTQRRYGELMDKLKVDEEDLESAMEVIQRLNPKPGEASDSMRWRSAEVVPDIIVYVQDEKVDFVINDRYIPKLRVDSSYMELLQEMRAGEKRSSETVQTEKFITKNADAANLFIEALDMRQRTIWKVMKAIVKHQRRYFQTGVMGDLVPMMQKDIAEEVGMDVSTISRMVNSKYVRTPYGTMQLKELFTNAVTRDGGEVVSSEAVKDLLREAVEGEDKRKPLTDDELTAMLNEKGFKTARRTVAKYREALGIPVARLRRGLKAVIVLMALAALPQAVLGQNADKKRGAAAQTDDNKTEQAAANRNGQMPAVLWYGNNFSDARVRLKELPMDSLPDEINIKLLRKGEQFAFPVKNPRTSPYGWRWERPHRGVDIGLKTGEPIHCAFDGVVRIAKPMGGYGNLVVVRHYNGLETVYGHLSKINVKTHQEIKAGEVLGLGGSTGHSTGPHLHFEVRFQYEAFDPEWILDFATYTLRTQRLHLDKSYFGIKKPRGKRGESIVYKADKSFIKEPEHRGAREMFYVIKGGDSLSEIAHRYSTTVEKIRELNEGLAKKPKPGTKIRVR